MPENLYTSALAPAKVNLILNVLAGRPDGFHEISSLMTPISLSDTINITISDGSAISVTTDNPAIPDGPGNLAYKAAELFLEEARLTRSVAIDIAKLIPVGAGLGGGSSDAATVLMLLNEILGDLLTAEELSSIAARLGSDVPFFLLKKPALASGRGELLEPLELQGLAFVLINPGFPVSARFAYENLLLTKSSENNILMYSQFPNKVPIEIAKTLSNDLERAVIKAHPEIVGLKDRLIEAGALGALMSGSGPTVFGIFKDGEEAAKAGKELTDELAGFSVFCANSI